MSPTLVTRPLAVALAAILVAGGGAAHAAAAADARDAAVPAPPAAPAVPDVNALVAQARELAKRARPDEAALLALDDALMSLPASMAFVANEFGNPREIVKNAPYTAEAVTETVQVLPDGNRIVRKSTTLLARDGAGRTRQERKGDGRSGVYIYDPMEDRSIVLNENSRTATRLPRVPMPPEPPLPPGAGPEAGPRAGAGTRDVEVQPGRVIVRRRDGGEAGGEQDVRVEVIRIGRGEHVEGLPPPPPMPPLTLPLLPRGKGETKSLGTREFDGVKAEGKLTTHTIAAGEIGNEKAIVVTSERWFSPDLHVVVYAKTSDPRAGETTYRLANVKRGEPPADLFKVPADYKTRGETRRG
jgi:hypothetical protein